MELPRDIFEEASLTFQKVEKSDTGILTVAEPGAELPEGMTAEILSMVASDMAQLSLPIPAVKQLSNPFPAECLSRVRYINVWRHPAA